MVIGTGASQNLVDANLMRAWRFPRIAAFIVLGIACPVAANDEEKTPGFGSWKGFALGTYVIEKHTYRGVTYHADGIEYRQTVLAALGESGQAKFQDYTSQSATGPWKMALAHSDTPQSRAERRDSKTLPEEDVSVNHAVFHCLVTETVRTDDWGQTTTKQWTDGSSVVLRERRQYEGRDSKGQPASWTSMFDTVDIEKRTVGHELLDCFVQEHHWSGLNNTPWRRIWITSNVPGQRVAMIAGKSESTPPELEVELVAWGRDVSLLAAMKADSPHFSNERRQNDSEQQKRQSEQLEKAMVADLASGEAARMSSAMNAVSQWADIIPDATKAGAIEALKKALDHPDVEVRRSAGRALGQLGVRGLSARIAEMLRKDPDGAERYLEALGLQADADALSAILPSLRDSKEAYRRAAVGALRFFKDDTARGALEKALTDLSSHVRYRAVESLEKIGNPRSVPALLPVLRDDDAGVVLAAIRVVATLGDDSAVPPLLDLLKKGNKDVRASVCSYLGKIHLKEPAPVGDALLPLIDDPDPRVRAGAILSLGAIGEKRAVPRLIHVIEQPADPKSVDSLIPRLAALVALGEIGDPAAIPALVKLLDNPDSAERAVETLIKLREPSVAEYLVAHYIRTANDDALRQAHRKEIEALGKLGTAETRAALESYLARCPPPQKKAIREAISGIDQRIPR
jgi:HEAT repeat protein